MKKNYLAPKSETLSAILKDMCQGPTLPPIVQGSATTNMG